MLSSNVFVFSFARNNSSNHPHISNVFTIERGKKARDVIAKDRGAMTRINLARSFPLTCLDSWNLVCHHFSLHSFAVSLSVAVQKKKQAPDVESMSNVALVGDKSICNRACRLFNSSAAATTINKALRHLRKFASTHLRTCSLARLLNDLACQGADSLAQKCILS